MARSKKPRKPYRPKPVDREAAGRLLDIKHRTAMALEHFEAPLDVSDQVKLAVSLGTSIERLAKGEGDSHDMNSIIAMTNLSRMLMEKGFGEEYLNDVIQAQDALFRAKLRYAKFQKYGFDGVGLSAVRLVYEIHTAQIELAGQGHLLLAERESFKRMKEGDVYVEARAA